MKRKYGRNKIKNPEESVLELIVGRKKFKVIKTICDMCNNWDVS